MAPLQSDDRRPHPRAPARRARATAGGRRRARRASRDAREAARAAHALRELVAGSAIDCADQRHLRVDRDLEQVALRRDAARTRPSSAGCWTRCRSSGRSRSSVHVHALDRLRERSRFKARHRRLFGVNRGAELRGRTPDYEMLAQEEELGELLKELSGHERAAAFEVVDLPVDPRARPRPRPGPARRGGRAGRHARSSPPPTPRVNRGQLRQLELWQSSLPLGRDVARLTRKYVTRHVGDTVPLVGTACGSPTRDPVRVHRPRPRGRADQPVRPGARQRHAARQRRARAAARRSSSTSCSRACLAHGMQALRARPRRPLRVPLPADPRRAST